MRRRTFSLRRDGQAAGQGFTKAALKVVLSLVILLALIPTSAYASPERAKVERGVPQVVSLENQSGTGPFIQAAGPPIVGELTSDFIWKYKDTFLYRLVYSDGRIEEVGKVNVDVRITLNGKQSRWDMVSNKFSGPKIRATHSFQCPQCDDKNTQTVASLTYRSSSFSTPSNGFSSKSGTYWYGFKFSWKAEGRGDITWTTGTAESFRFVCDVKKEISPCAFKK